VFVFWDDVIAPILDAVRARRVVEVGALLGQHTERMLERLGPDVELHVIDPQPYFDPAEQERRFAGRYVFHRDLSVNVLGNIPPVDAAIIDGDHNWYTVFTELRLLADVARRAGAPMPVTILHDVGWPYGRRDLYYDPTNVPDEHKQPWRRAGLLPGRSELAGGGVGLNPGLAHAEHQGGPRNGVMTGVDDFVAAHDEPVRLVVLPLLFGLAILVEEARLAALPELAERLAWLESAAGRGVLLRLGEDFRVTSLAMDQSFLKQRDDRVERLRGRYLDAITSAVVDDGDACGSAARKRVDRLRECLDALVHDGRPGDVAVMGAGLAGPAAFAAAFLDAARESERPGLVRRLWIGDPFRRSGSDDLGRTREVLRRFDLLGDRVHVLAGAPEEQLSALDSAPLAVLDVSVDGASDAPTVLERLRCRLLPEGVVLD
jgi:hypothetical protein